MTISMSPPIRRTVLITVLLVSASAAQSVWAQSISTHLYGARPDFLLVAALICAQFCTAAESAAVGFAAGVLTASLAAPYDGGFGSLVVSRTMVCFGVGWLEERVFRDNAAISIALVGGGTIIAESLFYACDPHFPVISWAKHMGLEVAVNTFASVPAYLIVRQCLRPRTVVMTGPIS